MATACRPRWTLNEARLTQFTDHAVRSPTSSRSRSKSQILEALRAERQRGHFHNLVVAPTGTGKTWVSAFDYAQLRRAGFERLLFVAHRNEILEQSQKVFRRVLGDEAFGERLVGGERPERWDHVFASIQSLHRQVEQLDPSQFDVVIVDEFHHAEAATYREAAQAPEAERAGRS